MTSGPQDANYWCRRWREGRIGFHRGEVNRDLRDYAGVWLGDGARRVLVPLCGKSLDLTYLAEAGHKVVGVEVAEEAVAAFHRENGRVPRVEENPPFRDFVSENLRVRVGDFFDLDPTGERFEAIYDRAALVALPQDVRARYAAHLVDLLLPQGRILLVGCRYRTSGDFAGPPFSVEDAELEELFATSGKWERLEARDGFRDYPKLAGRGLQELRSDLFLFEKERDV